MFLRPASLGMLLVSGIGIVCAAPAQPINPNARNAKELVMPQTTGAERKRAADVKPYNIYEDSQILVSSAHHTLVPKQSVLFIPSGLEGRVVKTQPNTPFVVYANFVKDNSASFTTHEVSMEQALGKAPLDKDLATKWANEGKIVVATHQKHPVSVQPYKDPKAGENKTTKP